MKGKNASYAAWFFAGVVTCNLNINVLLLIDSIRRVLNGYGDARSTGPGSKAYCIFIC